MKYSDYLIHGDIIDIESLQTNNFYLKYPIRIISLPVSVIGIMTIVGLIPAAFAFDQYRNTKYIIIKHIRNKHITINKIIIENEKI